MCRFEVLLFIGNGHALRYAVHFRDTQPKALAIVVSGDVATGF